MQIFIVYGHIHDLIVLVQIMIRFYPSLSRKKIALWNSRSHKNFFYKHDYKGGDKQNVILPASRLPDMSIKNEQHVFAYPFLSVTRPR